ncbi:hypothetical protein MMC22_008554 [Lobaria immixta]|nr:hypothetical protein [Lobaria immixta]
MPKALAQMRCRIFPNASCVCNQLITQWDQLHLLGFHRRKVTALAMNSTPTAALRNTCAGITELQIFKLPVCVLVAKDGEGEGEHLELVFGNVDQKMVKDTTIKANPAYGTMPSSARQRGNIY